MTQRGVTPAGWLTTACLGACALAGCSPGPVRPVLGPTVSTTTITTVTCDLDGTGLAVGARGVELQRTVADGRHLPDVAVIRVSRTSPSAPRTAPVRLVLAGRDGTQVTCDEPAVSGQGRRLAGDGTLALRCPAPAPTDIASAVVTRLR